MKETRDTPKPTMTDEEMIEDYPRLKLEYTRLHEDYRRLNNKQLRLNGVTGSLKVDTREFSNISMILLEGCNDLTEKTNRAIEINKYITIVDDPKD